MMNDEWRKEAGIRWNPVSKKSKTQDFPETSSFIVHHSSFGNSALQTPGRLPSIAAKFQYNLSIRQLFSTFQGDEAHR
jgi:hypothetical protein